MKHHNDNLPCAIDIETSGLILGYHEILQVAVVPLGDDFRWYKRMKWFNGTMRPDHPDRVDVDAMKVLKRDDTSLDYSNVVISRAEIARFCNIGMEQSRCADLFVEWFEGLQLKPKKRILPVGHNLAFDMPMIKNWIGVDTYEYIFDPRWRDTMVISLFWNDVDAFRGDRCTFKDGKLGSVCTSLKVENLAAHNAFNDAVATAECYGRMVKQFNLTAVIPEDDDLPHSDSVAYRQQDRYEDKLLPKLDQSLKDKIVKEWLDVQKANGRLPRGFMLRDPVIDYVQQPDGAIV